LRSEKHKKGEEKMALLSAAEVFQFAVRIEENGFAFYNRYAGTLPQGNSRDMFSFLADEERKHIAIFSGMLDEIDEFKQALNYPDQYFAYLQSYADNLIFKKGELEKEIANIKDAAAAIDFGIRRELDSILYYQEIKSFVPDKDSHLIEDVIGEERKHFIKLSQFKKKL
jgi:rubrerythrin